MDIKEVPIAVIGGSGLYHLDHLEVVKEVYPDTPWGKPSDSIVIVKIPNSQTNVAFLARHGRGHPINPSEIPVRANIAALKSIGVKVILSFSAVGSLREEIKPRDFALPDQIIDRTNGIRPSTFFENGLAAHVTFGDPFEKELADLIYEFKDSLEGSVDFHRDKLLICMEGPAFSTRAESNLYRSWGGDLINMSALPEAKLAREAEIAYQMVCMSTDYDCWKEDEEAVTVETVVANLNHNTNNAKRLLLKVLPALANRLDSLKCVKRLQGIMKFACITAKERRNPEQVKKLNTLLPGYY